jgi:protein-S-isoprenylcysteine O-methyltransferase Ste14
MDRSKSIKGKIFVGIQFSLFLFYCLRLNIKPLNIPEPIRIIGLTLSLFGLVIVILPIISMGKNISPFPEPVKNATLIIKGIYRYIRHPMYSGILVGLFGYSLYSENILRLMIVSLLTVLFIFKTVYEEQALATKFSGYDAYKKKTGRFFPRIFWFEKS